MIELTPEQALALDREPQPARVVDPRTNTAYVLVPENVYQRVEALLDDDELPNVGALINEVMAEDDANDPWLESYQKYRKEA
jgi:hypothetical protein